MESRSSHDELSRSIIGGFYDVYNYYGFGLAESVYCGALELELVARGHAVAREVSVAVRYKGHHVAWQRLDMLVDRTIIVEIKAAERLAPYARRQLVNYLRATPLEVGILLFFGPTPRFWRITDAKPPDRAGSAR